MGPGSTSDAVFQVEFLHVLSNKKRTWLPHSLWLLLSGSPLNHVPDIPYGQLTEQIWAAVRLVKHRHSISSKPWEVLKKFSWQDLISLQKCNADLHQQSFTIRGGGGSLNRARRNSIFAHIFGTHILYISNYVTCLRQHSGSVII